MQEPSGNYADVMRFLVDAEEKPTVTRLHEVYGPGWKITCATGGWT